MPRTGDASDSGKHPWTVLDSLIVPQGTPVKTYLPSKEHPRLFLDFARVPIIPSEILKFADDYGLLGLVTEGPPDAGERPETVVDWAGQIWEMRTAVDLWLMVQQEDVDNLTMHFQVVTNPPGQRSVVFRSLYDAQLAHKEGLFQEILNLQAFGIPTQETIASTALNPEMVEVFENCDLLAAARRFLAQKVNGHLPRPFHGQLTVDAGGTRLEWDVIPRSLIDALWLQLAQAISAGKTYRECKECGSWFEVSPEAKHRSNRRFCSDSCRTKAYRKRQERAREMRGRGVDVGTIAEKLDTSRKSAEKWVNERKSRN
jgi:hypothetical protein